MFDFSDHGKRATLIGFQHQNEDLNRETEDKTSAVHFVRFELTQNMCAHAKVGLPINFGIDHPYFKTDVIVPAEVQRSLINDLK